MISDDNLLTILHDKSNRKQGNSTREISPTVQLSGESHLAFAFFFASPTCMPNYYVQTYVIHKTSRTLYRPICSIAKPP